MQSTVKVGGVLAGLMSRLAKYAADVPSVVPQFQSEDAFGKFSEAIAKVIAAQPEIATVDVVSMYSSLMMFALQVHREQISYVDTVLSGCATALRSRGMVSEPKVGPTQPLRVFISLHLTHSPLLPPAAPRPPSRSWACSPPPWTPTTWCWCSR